MDAIVLWLSVCVVLGAVAGLLRQTLGRGPPIES